MHITTIFLMSLSAGAYAYPTTTNNTNDTSSSLEKRDYHGWVRNFLQVGCPPSTWDQVHNGIDISNNDQCYQWRSSSPYLGIDWGRSTIDQADQFTNMYFYNDSNCKVKNAQIQSSGGMQNGQCVNLADLTANGFNAKGPASTGGYAAVGSVMGTNNPDL